MKLKKYKLRKLCLPNQIGKYGIPAPAIAYSKKDFYLYFL